jgi:DnaJ-like protein
MADDADYYALLEVQPDADDATIRLAFRRLARVYHPDVAGSGSLERMQRLNVAYQTLSDPERRRAYDSSRGLAARPTPASDGATAASAARPMSPRHGMLQSTPGPFNRLATLQSPDATPAASVAFSADAARAAVGLLDGRAQLWDVPARRLLTTLAMSGGSPAGVLHEVRLSPSGAFAAAWGLQLGTRVWNLVDGRTVWNSGINGPSGSMDAALFDAPPYMRLALPDAPLALADDDPFRWAHDGRLGTNVLTRPLAGPISPAWAVPLHCEEAGQPSRFDDPAETYWRVQQRMLSADARLLFTFSTGKRSGRPAERHLSLWELDHKAMLGGSQPRRLARTSVPAEHLAFPLALTPDLAWAAAFQPGGQVTLFALRGNERRAILTGPIPDDARMALAPRAEYLAVASADRLSLWETRTARCLQQWRFDAAITALAFTAAGGRPLLVVGLGNGLVELWS